MSTPTPLRTASQPFRRGLSIIGLGNDLLSDDGLGLRTVRQVRERLDTDAIAFRELAVGGLGLLDHFLGVEECFVVDAVVTGENPPGTIYKFVYGKGEAPSVVSSSHQIDLSQVLALGRILGGNVPSAVTVYGIEPSDIVTFQDECTPAVSNAIPFLVDLICRDARDTVPQKLTDCDRWQVIHSEQTD